MSTLTEKSTRLYPYLKKYGQSVVDEGEPGTKILSLRGQSLAHANKNDMN